MSTEGAPYEEHEEHVEEEEEEVSEEEKIAIVRSFLLQSPPGELSLVANGTCMTPTSVSSYTAHTSEISSSPSSPTVKHT